MSAEKIAIVGGGPVGSLAALYAAQRGYQVELYELRPGMSTVRKTQPLQMTSPHFGRISPNLYALAMMQLCFRSAFYRCHVAEHFNAHKCLSLQIEGYRG